MSIISDIIRGQTDTIILSSLMEKDSYGYEINKKIKLCSDGKYELNEATLYTAFKRLEDSGCISSYGGRRRPTPAVSIIISRSTAKKPIID